VEGPGRADQGKAFRGRVGLQGMAWQGWPGQGISGQVSAERYGMAGGRPG